MPNQAVHTEDLTGHSTFSAFWAQSGELPSVKAQYAKVTQSHRTKGSRQPGSRKLIIDSQYCTLV
ncbi:hypothetical protein N7467_003785 [Penicillium canescens]|nr:hypothetical protein N7467_003785 [Penicillium canescens]